MPTVANHALLACCAENGAWGPALDIVASMLMSQVTSFISVALSQSFVLDRGNERGKCWEAK